jgi:hypothetical protein
LIYKYFIKDNKNEEYKNLKTILEYEQRADGKLKVSYEVRCSYSNMALTPCFALVFSKFFKKKIKKNNKMVYICLGIDTETGKSNSLGH